MPEESIQRLKHQLEQLVGEDPSYKAYLDAVRNAEREIARLHTPDGFRRIPAVTQESRQRLMELHRKIGQAAEGVYRSEGNEERKRLVKKITALAAGNHRALQRYDPQEPKSLPELLESVRTLKVDTRGSVLREPVGANQNKRQPLTFLDEQGREITGLFTPTKKIDHWERMEKRLQKRAENDESTEAGKAYLRGFMAALDSPKGALALGLPEDADRSAKLAALYTLLVQSRETGFDTAVAELMEKLYSTPEQPVTKEELLKQIGSKPAKGVAVELYKLGTAIINNNQIAKIHDGARMDNRNAAMNAVAELLNVPQLLAKSVPMEMIDQNGKVVKGTFMLEAKGVDVGNLSEEDSFHDQSSLRNLDGRAMKSIADLQVLDYICGNTDRHSGNVAYIFSERTNKLIGIQGFDNDTAFGTLVPKPGDDVGFLTLPENMMAVSESMYQRLQEITPEILKFSLRGFGLSEEELDAAVQRMDHLKKVLEAGKEFHAKRDEEIKAKREAMQKSEEWVDPNSIDDSLVVGDKPRILKDEQWRDLSWKELDRSYRFRRYKDCVLQEEKQEGNFFGRAWRQVRAIPHNYENQKKAYRELKAETAIGTGNRALAVTVDQELEKARQMEQTLKDRTKRFHSSGNYDKMQEAAANYLAFQERLQQRLTGEEPELRDVDPQADLPVVTTEDLQKMQDLSRAMRASAEVYLRGKGILPKREGENPRHTLDDYEPYTQRRIEAAQTLLEFGRSGERLKENEIEVASRNELRARERLDRRYGDKLEQEGWVALDRPEAQAIQP